MKSFQGGHSGASNLPAPWQVWRLIIMACLIPVLVTLLFSGRVSAQTAIQISGYPDYPSTIAGQPIVLHVSTTAPMFRMDFYREGIDGTGRARPNFYGSSAWFTGQNAPVGTGYADWNWPAYSVTVPSSWPSGAYIAMLTTGDANGNVLTQPDSTTPDGTDSKIFFVVRSSSPGTSSTILYKLSFHTYHAYNYTGNNSLYRTQFTNQTPFGYKVTLHRPGGGTGGIPGDTATDAYDGSSARQTFAHWDAPMIAWLERNGYHVDYCTDEDIHRDGNVMTPYRLVMSVGHDEYWSQEERDHFANYILGGGNVAFLSGNTCWWRIHYTDNNTAIVCDRTGSDQWFSGANQPENSLTGVSYRNGGGWWDGARQAVGYTVQNSGHWVYANTGLKDGSVFGDTDHLVGYECDGALFQRNAQGTAVVTGTDGTPLNFTILGTGALNNLWEDHNGAAIATMGLYTQIGTVFTGASVDWPRVLNAGLTPAAETVVKNVLNRLGNLVPPPPSVPPTPLNVTAAPGDKTVALQWNGDHWNTSYYQVLRSTTNGGPYSIIATNLTNPSYQDSAVVNGTTYYYVVTAVNSVGSSPNSSQVAATPSTLTALYQINSGGPAVGSFVADQNFSGGNTSSTGATISTAGVANAAPAGVYQSERYGTFSYSFTGLNIGAAYTVRLHFAEIFYTAPGQRVFSVSINGNTVLSNFDIVAAAGAANKAVVREIVATANSTGAITINYLAGSADLPKSSGVELYSGVRPPTVPVLSGTPGNAQVNLSWTSDGSATSFVVKRGTVSGGPYTNVATGLTGTTYTDSGLTNGTTYYYVVAAVNAGGTSANSNQVAATPQLTPPAAPMLSATPGNGQVGLRWTTDGTATSVSLLRSTVAGGPYSPIATGLTVTTYTDSGLTNGTTYYYVATASNSAGSSPNSGQVAATPSALTALYQINSGGPAVGSFVADQNFSGGNTSSTGADIATAGVANAAPGGVYQTERYGVFNYGFTGLIAGGSYTVRLHFAEIYYTAAGQRVFSVSINGNTVLSNFDIVAAAGGANKAVVREFVATADSTGAITINYLAGSADLPKSSGVELYSGVQPPAAPVLSGTPGSARVNLSWTSNGTATSFVVKRSTVSGGPYTNVATGVTGTTYTDSGLTNGTTYYYVVAAVNAGGTSANSNQVAATPQLTPPAAPVLSATPGNGQVSLQWTSDGTATSFTVKRGTVSGGPYTSIASGLTGTTYTDTGLTNGTTYYYVVVAANAAGTSPNSNQVSAAPTSLVKLLQINSGGPAVGSFVADQNFSGGNTAGTSATITTAGVANAAPAAVYQTERYGAFNYRFTGLTPGSTYTVRLHFAEIYYTAAGQRVFSVNINGNTVLSNFDIVAAAGGANKAVVRDFTATADSSGAIQVNYVTGSADLPKSSGVELYSGTP